MSGYKEAYMLAFENVPVLHFVSPRSKSRLFKTIALIYELSLKSRKKGILALEENLDDFVFRFDRRDTYLALDFLRAVVDGDYDEQYAYMKHLVASSGGSKVTKLCHEILAVGCSCIVENVNSVKLVFFLSALLGLKLRERFFHSKELRPYLINSDLGDRIFPKKGMYVPDENETENQGKILNDTQKDPNQDLENLVNLPDLGIQKVLREVDEDELRDALKFASRKLQNKFLCNMSMTAGRHLRREIDAMESLSESRQTAAQEAILRAVRRLKDNGEIL